MRSRAIPILLVLAAAGGGEARTIRSADRQLDFAFSWPALPPGLPHLEARLAAEAAEARNKARRDAAESWARERNDSGDAPPKHSYEKKWSIRASTPRLLALEGDLMVYTGGAHEGIGYDALLWDRKADRPLAIRALFTRPERAIAAMEKAYCAELKAAQRERRGDGFVAADFRCPPLAKEPVVLTGARGRIAGFEVLLEPYAAGSWAEGPYEVEVRFGRAIAGLVRPEFKPSLAS